MLDMSYDNSANGTTNSALRSDPTDASIGRFLAFCSAHGAPTTWSGSVPSPSGLNVVPQARFQLTGGVTPSLSVSGGSSRWHLDGQHELHRSSQGFGAQCRRYDWTRRQVQRLHPCSSFDCDYCRAALYRWPYQHRGLELRQRLPNSYDIQSATDTAFTTPLLNTNVATTSATASGLTHGTLYNYRVRAVKNGAHMVMMHGSRTDTAGFCC